MASVSSATFSGHGARSLLQFLRLVGQLKRVPRTGWVYRNVQRPESVSDHMYRMAVMAMVIKDDRLNKDRCVRLALVHDMAECIVGDIAPADNIPKEEKHRREEEAMKQITQLLPEDLRKELYELWEEYETQSSAEAKFVKQLDQCEMILQASEYEDLEHKPGRLQDFYDSTADVSLFVFNCLDFSKKCDTTWALKEATEQEAVMKVPWMKTGGGSACL
ncbi:5'-deoxynucleotidase HDDC2 isoform X1 [Gorilla gorilla gorilla]|uniref:5'-deoxynucleotidase HDDC2 isoform X3 n=2 Tax=Homininae TaxID=207598 RepID=UPI000511CC6B|nr:5'-deoxynucleotidase HDDC2 isoform X3 [Pan troglodytes]XP_018885290.2 5'-deoxynucleotidase HDDC2 isoform X3 [Gorilla gorilla gorilla]